MVDLHRTRHRTATRIATAFAALTAALITVMWASPAHAQPNPNPIDWTIVGDYFDLEGNDIPLRLGQHDLGPIDGFGERHIIDGHGEVPQGWEILNTLQYHCGPPGPDGRIRCMNAQTWLFIVYNSVVDPRSGDGRPFGIITAYHVLPGCGPSAQVTVQQDCGEVDPLETGLEYTGPASAINGEPLEVSANLVDYPQSSPVVGKDVTFTLGEGDRAQTCTGTTGPGGAASCTIDPVDQPPGSVELDVSFSGDAGFLPSHTTATLTLQSPTVTEYTGATHIANGEPATLRATLTDAHAHADAPLEGKPLAFTLGEANPQSCTGTTGADGVAECTIATVAQPLNGTATVPVTADFAGDDAYLPSDDAAVLLLEYYTGRAYGVGADLTPPLLPPVELTEQPDTGTIRAAAPVQTDTPCAAALQVVLIDVHGLCPTVTISLNPGTVTAASTVERAAVGLPGIADITVDGLVAEATASCAGATGSTSAVLRIGGTVIPITGAANQEIALPGGATIVVNEQTPTEDGTGLAVTGLHITAPGLADIRLAAATGAAHHCAAALT